MSERRNFAGLVLGGPASGRWQVMDSPELHVALAPELAWPNSVETDHFTPLREAIYRHNEIVVKDANGFDHRYGFWVDQRDHGRPDRILAMLVAGYERPPSQGV